MAAYQSSYCDFRQRDTMRLRVQEQEYDNSYYLRFEDGDRLCSVDLNHEDALRLRDALVQELGPGYQEVANYREKYEDLVRRVSKLHYKLIEHRDKERDISNSSLQPLHVRLTAQSAADGLNRARMMLRLYTGLPRDVLESYTEEGQ